LLFQANITLKRHRLKTMPQATHSTLSHFARLMPIATHFVTSVDHLSKSSNQKLIMSITNSVPF